MTPNHAEQIVRDFEETPIREWSYPAIDALVADFASLPLADRRAILAGMGYGGMAGVSGRGCGELLGRRLKARLASWQRIQTIGAR